MDDSNADVFLEKRVKPMKHSARWAITGADAESGQQAVRGLSRGFVIFYF
jgi:hypothetical protein